MPLRHGREMKHIAGVEQGLERLSHQGRQPWFMDGARTLDHAFHVLPIYRQGS